MTDVVSFEKAVQSRTKAPKRLPTLKDVFGDDDWLLKVCAEWRAARAQQEKNWTEHELATGFGYLPDRDIDLDREPLRRMRQLEYHLAMCEPRTIMLARQLLRMCVTILAHQQEDPEHTFSEGPVLDIVRNVLKALDELDGDTVIGTALCEKRKAARTKRRR